ncbi:MAG: GNAT family N-acetyltransferase [Micromonosporaceae bacterium]
MDDIARVQYATWRTAYPRFIPRFAIDAVQPEWLAEQWRAAVTAPPTGHHRVLVAIEQTDSAAAAPEAASSPPAPLREAPEREAPLREAPETLVGFAAVGPADEAALAPGETGHQPGLAAFTDLLVEPRWGRRGHGSRLLAAAVDLWREDGFTGAVAWAFESDTATVSFLSSAGWEPDGTARALDVEGVHVPQVRLHVALDAPAAP